MSNYMMWFNERSEQMIEVFNARDLDLIREIFIDKGYIIGDPFLNKDDHYFFIITMKHYKYFISGPNIFRIPFEEWLRPDLDPNAVEVRVWDSPSSFHWASNELSYSIGEKVELDYLDLFDECPTLTKCEIEK